MHRTWLVTFILKRLLYAVPLVVAVVVVNFILIKAAPGDPVTVLIGDYPATQDYIDQIRAQYGLDQPLHVQLWLYLSEVAKGNLGESLSQHQPVAALLLDRLGQTVKLTLTALAIATVAGVALGTVGARWRGTPVDSTTQGVTLLGYSVPEFWLGQLRIIVFAGNLGWLPLGGAQPVRGADFTWLDVLPSLVLPARELSVS